MPDTPQPLFPTSQPPRKKASAALVATIVLSIVGVFATGIVLFAIAFQFTKGFRDAAARRGGNVEPEWVGPNPWRPERKLECHEGRYLHPPAGLAVNLPAEPVKHRTLYTSDQAKELKDYFNYDVDDEAVYGVFYGLRERDASLATLERAQQTYELMYRDDPIYQSLKLESSPISLSGRAAYRFAGSYRFMGQEYHLAGLAFVSNGFLIGIDMTSDSRDRSDRALSRIQQSIEWR
jgi:hypothetical protein